MLILPFTHKSVVQNNFEVNIINILTVGGKNIWKEDDTLNIDDDILNPSDIYRKGNIITYKKKLQLCEVDDEKTNIKDFYNWKELDITDSDTFCWRTLYYFTGFNKLCWLETPNSEKLGNYTIQELIKIIIEKK